MHYILVEPTIFTLKAMINYKYQIVNKKIKKCQSVKTYFV